MTPPTDKAHPEAKPNSVVIIVDDDAAIRAALDSLFRSIGLETRLFGSPAELLGGTLPDGPAASYWTSVFPASADSTCRANWRDRASISRSFS